MPFREQTMRILMMLAVAVAMLSLDAGSSAKAEYRGDRWCAWYDAYARNCGFATFQQCLATISGVGGICRENVFATPAAYAEGPRPRRHKRKHHH
jgi:hypothetical protein